MGPQHFGPWLSAKRAFSSQMLLGSVFSLFSLTACRSRLQKNQLRWTVLVERLSFLLNTIFNRENRNIKSQKQYIVFSALYTSLEVIEHLMEKRRSILRARRQVLPGILHAPGIGGDIAELTASEVTLGTT